MIPSKNNKESYFILLISCFSVLVGLAVRVLYIIKYPVPVRDAYNYAQHIQNWDTIRMTTPPLSLSLLRIPYCYFRLDVMKSGIIVNMILGIAIILLFIVVMELISSSKRCILIVGIIAALHPSLVHYSCEMLRENSFIFFSLLAIISTILYTKRNNNIFIALTALFCACSVLCRHEAIEFVVYFMLFAIIFHKKDPKRFLKCYGLFFFSYLISFFLILNCFSSPVHYLKVYTKYLNFMN